MKLAHHLFRTAFYFVLSFSLAAEMAELPTWRENERAELEAKGWSLGALLLQDEDPPQKTEPERPPSQGAEQKISPEIPENFIAAYFAERPKTFLLDPQGLLTPAEYKNGLHFLTEHSRDSSIDLFVYLIGGEQEIPSAVREEEVIDRFFTIGKPATIVFYYFGAPQRSLVYLSPSMTEKVSDAQQRRALATSVEQAMQRPEAAAQFEKFLVQMSIRVYWMEPRPMTDVLPLSTTKKKAAPEISSKVKLMMAIQEMLERYGVKVGIFSVLGVILWAVRRWMKTRARYEFPMFVVEPRLGADQGAGIGSVISFSDNQVSPASQRDQVPNYLRRD